MPQVTSRQEYKWTRSSGYIPVAIAANNNYAETLAVCLYSLLDNTHSPLDLIVLADGISEENQGKIRRSLKAFSDFKLRFIDMGGYGLERFPDVAHFSLSAFSRYFIPEICPEYDKVVYTDADVIFTHDVADYYATDLHGCGLAATPEEIGAERYGKGNHACRKKLFGLPESHRYFTSGNLILDCRYWRKHHITEQLVDKTIELKDALVCPDLDVLNIVFAEKYKKLGYTYSCSAHRERLTNGNAEMEDAYRNPLIIHYSGNNKPWNTENVVFSEAYRSILDKTEYRSNLSRYSGGNPYRILKRKYRHLRYMLAKTLPWFTSVHVRIATVGDAPEDVEFLAYGGMMRTPWNDEPFGGSTLVGNGLHSTIKLRALKDTILHLAFGPMPLQDVQGAFPLVATYKQIRINGKGILAHPVKTYRNTPYLHSVQLQAGELLDIGIEQCRHTYRLAEIKEVLTRRYPKSLYGDIASHKGMLSLALYLLILFKHLRGC